MDLPQAMRNNVCEGWLSGVMDSITQGRWLNQLAPELHHVLVDLLAGHDIDRFHDGQQECQPQGQGYEQEVIHRRDCKLQTGYIDEMFCYHVDSLV
jgi:hypothetical protein